MSFRPATFFASARLTALAPAALLACAALVAAPQAFAQATTPAVRFLPDTTIVAGNGTKSYTGDGGPALSAGIGNAAVAPATSTPAEAAIEDPYGNIYIVDTGNNAIRRVDAATGIITTVVGGNATVCATAADKYGDGCPATQALLNTPESVRYFRGDLYIADNLSNYVRVVSGATGIISIFAGNGTGTTSVAGTDATKISTRAPQDVLLDAAGDVYIATGGGSPSILRVDAVTHAVAIVAGTGVAGTSGDGGPATSAQIQTVVGIALDPQGNVYLASSGNNNVRVVTIPPGAVTGIITPYVGTSGLSTAGFAGDGQAASTAELNGPQHIAIDVAGNLYIADQKNHRIRMVTPPSAGSIISTVAGTGTPANSASGVGSVNSALNNPRSVDLTAAGDLIISDGFNAEIKIAAPPVNTPPTAVGSSTTFNALARVNTALTLGTYAVPAGYPAFTSAVSTNCAAGAAIAAGAICTVPVTFAPTAAGPTGAPLQFTDSNGNIYTLPLSGIGSAPAASLLPGLVAALAGTGTAGNAGDNAAATAAQLHTPTRVAVDGMGKTFIVDSANNEVREVSATTGAITRVAGTGAAGFSGDGAAATAATLNAPTALAVDGAGNLYIADTGNNRIRFVTNGIISTFAGTGTAAFTGDGGPAAQATLSAPKGLHLTPAGVLYVADSGNNAVRIIGVRSTAITTIAGTGVAGYAGDTGASPLAQLNAPAGVTVDAAGVVYIADSGNNVIRRVASGFITTLAGAGTAGFANGAATAAMFSNPTGLAVDAAANLYVADTGNSAIRRITAGQVSTVAGTGTAGFTGNGGASNIATLSGPRGIALDGLGNLLIADSGNNAVRGINIASAKLAFPTTSPNTTSAPLVETLTNAGNLPLAGTGVTVPAGFAEQASGATDCNAAALSLAPAATCQAAIVFTPTAQQTYTGNVVLTDNSQSQAAATQTIAVSGTGAYVFTATITTPVTAVAGTIQTVIVTVTNPNTTYTGTVHFTSSDPKAVLPANYTFTAADNGKHTFTTVQFGTAGIQTITITDTTTASITATGSTTVVGGPAAALTIVSGSAQSANIGSGYAAALVVRVTDALGNPSTGASVTFTAPTTGADATFTGGASTITVVSNSLGIATTTAPPVADGVVGTFAVTAATTGAPAVSFALTNTSTLALGFKLVPSPAAIASLPPGTSATVTVSIVPVGGFNAPVSVTCGGAIATTTCTLSATTIAPSGTGAPTSFTLTLQTTGAAQARNYQPGNFRPDEGPGTTVYAGLFLLAAGLAGGKRKRLRGLVLALLLTATLLVANGCSTNNFATKSPAGAYNLTVVGTSGTLSTTLVIPYYIGGTPQ